MEKYYTLNDLAVITGLSTRTLRNYIKMNILCGEKIDGVWNFTEEEVNAFLGNPTVKPSIQAKSKAIVYDFLIDDCKKNNKICSILDLAAASDDEAKEIAEFFGNAISNLKGNVNIKFSYEKLKNNARVILSGDEEVVMEILNSYYDMK